MGLLLLESRPLTKRKTLRLLNTTSTSEGAKQYPRTRGDQISLRQRTKIEFLQRDKCCIRSRNFTPEMLPVFPALLRFLRFCFLLYSASFFRFLLVLQLECLLLLLVLSCLLPHRPASIYRRAYSQVWKQLYYKKYFPSILLIICH
jgi:hypothetical protein